MDNLSELDDCINNLEQLQLTLDFENVTVKPVPKIEMSPSPQRASENKQYFRLDQESPCYSVNEKNDYEEQTLSSNSHKSPTTNRSDIKYGEKEEQDPYPKSLIEMLDFQSVSVRRPKLMSPKTATIDSDLFPVPECDSTDFPPPPPPSSLINVDSDNYIKAYSPQTIQYQRIVNKNSSQLSIDDTISEASFRNPSINSLKLSPKIPELSCNTLQRNIYNNNNYNSESSSQSNISTYTDKEPRSSNSFRGFDTMSIREDSLKQTVVRFFTTDKTTKAIAVTENMNVEQVIGMLMEKHFWIPSLKSTVVEKVPSLKMERFFEEHECMINCINSWPSTCSNMIFFEPREDIYGLFDNAKVYLNESFPSGSLNVDVIKDLFIAITTDQHQYHDYLYIKKPGENSWKRKLCFLNHDGLFLLTKKKSKSSTPSIVMPFNDEFFLYTSTGGWTKLWDAPTPFGFAFKPYNVIDPKSTQIIMFCAADEVSMKRWCSNIRLCKYKNQILNNYQHLQNRSIYCSNLYSSGKHNNRLNSLSPPNSSKITSFKYNSRCSLPTTSLQYTKSHSTK